MIDKRFSLLDEKYQKIIDEIQQKNDIEINVIAQLKGARSGAFVYQVQVTKYDEKDAPPDIMIMKLIPPKKGSKEFANNKLAYRLASKKFKQKNMVTIPYYLIIDDNTPSVILYTMGGNSIREYKQASSYNSSKDLKHIFTELNRQILFFWINDRKTFVAKEHPIEILKSWLKDKIDEFDKIDTAYHDCFHSANISRNLIYHEKIYPNPICYLKDKELWGEHNLYSLIKGFFHGDLNTNNVLISFSKNKQIDGFSIIDFDHFRENEFLFFDNRYFELSYLLESLCDSNIDDCFKYFLVFFTENEAELKNIPATIAAIFLPCWEGRRRFKQWIQGKHESLYDNFLNQDLLAAVAVGINFFGKEKLTEKEKILSFFYSATSLKFYLELNNLALPIENAYPLFGNSLENSSFHNEWLKFFDEAEKFLPQNLFVLINGSDRKQFNERTIALSKIPWSIVLDFDQNAKERGLYSVLETTLNKNRALYLITIDDQDNFQPNNVFKSTYWYAANGLTDRVNSISNSFSDWLQKYPRKIRQYLSIFSKKSQALPIIVICIWDNDDYIWELYQIFNEVFSNQFKFLIITKNKNRVSETVRKSGSKVYDLDFNQICNELAYYLYNPDIDEKIALPAENGSICYLPLSDFRYIEQDLEIVHLDIGQEQGENEDVGHFLRGNTISWFELSTTKMDVEREINVDRDGDVGLKTRCVIELKERSNRRIQLYHFPGAGGTTVARRIAWDLHYKYPTVILNNISENTVYHIQKIRDITNNSVFVVIDNQENMSFKEALDSLHSNMQAHNVKGVVFLIVSRWTDKQPPNISSWVHYLRQDLTLSEAEMFQRIYTRVAPEKALELQELATRDDLRNIRMPFFFGLTAFEDQFTRLFDYVYEPLQESTENQRKILCYLSMVYYYAHQAIPSLFFNIMLGIAEKHSQILIHEYLTRIQQKLITFESKEGIMNYRPIHYVIAGELLKQILSGAGNSTNNWKAQLPVWSIKFIDDFSTINADHESPLYIETEQLVTNLFINRQTSALISVNKFSPLITDIDDISGAIAVFEKLISVFPKSEHIHAHFARLLARHDIERAIDEARSAIDIMQEKDEEDGVLWHIYGMIQRYKMKEVIEKLIKKSRYKKSSITDESIENVFSILKSISSSFSKSIELMPQSDYGYISHVQAIMDVIEFGFKASNMKNYEEFLNDSSSEKYVKLIDHAELLMDTLANTMESQGESLSDFARTAESKLLTIQQNHEAGLKYLRGIIKNDIPNKSLYRRRIAMTILHKHKNDWDKIQLSENREIMALLDNNLSDDPLNLRDLKIWFRSAIRLPDTSIDLAIQRLSASYFQTNDTELAYYLSMLHVLKVYDGSVGNINQAHIMLRELQKKSQYGATRISPYYWLGKGNGMQRLLYFKKFQEDFSELAKDQVNLDSVDLLKRQRGTITDAKLPTKGYIEWEYGNLSVFFVPGKRRNSDNMQFYGSDINKTVEFYLALSYAGLRAYQVDF